MNYLDAIHENQSVEDIQRRADRVNGGESFQSVYDGHGRAFADIEKLLAFILKRFPSIRSEIAKNRKAQEALSQEKECSSTPTSP